MDDTGDGANEEATDDDLGEDTHATETEEEHEEETDESQHVDEMVPNVTYETILELAPFL